MSRVGVFITVLVALTLGIAAWLLLGHTPSTPTNPAPGASATPKAATPILSFSPGAVQTIVITPAGDGDLRIDRVGDRWRLTIDNDSPRPADHWPIVGAQIRGLLSVLQHLTAQTAAPAATLPDNALTLTLTLADHSTQTLRLDTTAIGGRRLVQANDQPPVFINQPIYQALTSPGPMGWRDERLFPSVSVETSRIELNLGDGAISLARVQGQWFLRQPASAPADPVAVGQLLDQLAAVKSLRWIDDPAQRPATISPPTSPAPGSPSSSGVVAIEREERTLGENDTPRIVRHRQEITLGPPADFAGKERYATVGANRTPVVVDAGAIAALAIDPASLVSKTAVNAVDSQIASLKIVWASSTSAPPTTQTIARTLDGWTRAPSAAAGAQSPKPTPKPTPTPPVRELLALLTHRPADKIAFATPADLSPIATVELIGFGDVVLQTVSVSTDAGNVVIQTENIFRTYHNVETPAILTRD